VMLLASGFGDPFDVNCGPRLSCAEPRRPDVLALIVAWLPPADENVVLASWSKVVSAVVAGGGA
jgi:hypothetical protein